MKLQDSEKPLVEGKKEPVTKHTEFHELSGVCETHRHDHSVLGHGLRPLLDTQEGEVEKATATSRGKPAGPGPVLRSHGLQAKAHRVAPGPALSEPRPQSSGTKTEAKLSSGSSRRSPTVEPFTHARELPEPKFPEARDEPVSRSPR